MKYIHKSQAVVDSSEQIKLTGIADSILLLTENRCRLVLKCSAVNLELMSFEQQQVVLDIYQDLLNALDIPCQVLIRIRRHKPDTGSDPSAADSLRQRVLQADHGRLVKSLIQGNRVLTRGFYLVISHEQTEVDLSSMIWQLNLKAQIIQQNLQKLGVKAEILSNKAAARLLRESFNPLSDLNDNPDPMQANQPTPLGYESLVEEVDHLKINEIYASTLFVRSYPLAADASCLADLINFDSDIDISYHIEPVNNLFALEQLNRKITELESQKRSCLGSGKILTPQITDPLESALDLRAKLLRNQETLLQLSIYVAAFAKDREELAAIEQRLKNLLAGRLFIAEVAKWQQLPAWESCLPLGLSNLKEARRNFDSSSLALTFPFRSPELIEEGGVLYGLNKANNSLLMIDRFALPNANSVIFAQSGAGKSYTMKLEMLRYFLKGVKIIVIDPENEYQALCQALGGNHLEISKDSQQSLNPLQISVADSQKQKILREKLPALTQIIELMVEGLNADQKAALDKALLAIYQESDQPLLGDLQKILKKQGESQLCSRLEKFVSGSLSEVFARPTNINLDNPLTVFNIQKVDESLRPLIMMIIANFVNEQVLNKPAKRLLVIDEAWLLLQHRAAKEFVNALVRRARKYYLGVALVSQQVGDFYEDKQASALISQASLRILLRQDSTQIGVVSEQLGLSEYEQKFLLTCAKGEALIIADNQHAVARILASDSEHPLITTDPREVYADKGESLQ